MATTAPKTMIFADGENLVMRYQDMVAAGRKPKSTVKHIQDSFVWSPKITLWSCFDVQRVNYYTSVVGDDQKIHQMSDSISQVGYSFTYDPDPEIPEASAQIVPLVFKKDRQSRKTRNVDIQIIIDVMRHAISHDIEIVYLLTGDGDYLPLIHEVMRHGKQVYLSAFSSGLHPRLRSSVDLFSSLDDDFFTKPAKKA